MAATGVVESFLAELDRELRPPRRVRACVLAEAEDHLREASARNRAAGESPGDAERHATESFGSAPLVARRFAEQRALAAGRRVTRNGALLLAGFLALCELLTSSLIHVAGVGDGPATLVVWATGQVGLVAGVTALARGDAIRRAPVLDTTRLTYAARSQLVLA